MPGSSGNEDLSDDGHTNLWDDEFENMKCGCRQYVPAPKADYFTAIPDYNTMHEFSAVRIDV